jgi:hypothetical protein
MTMSFRFAFWFNLYFQEDELLCLDFVSASLFHPLLCFQQDGPLRFRFVFASFRGHCVVRCLILKGLLPFALPKGPSVEALAPYVHRPRSKIPP